MNRRISVPSLLSLIVFLFAPHGLAVQVDSAKPPKEEAKVVNAELGKTINVHRCGELFLAGQFEAADLKTISETGIKRIITLRPSSEINWDEAAAVKEQGIEFSQIPFRQPEELTDELIDDIRHLLRESQPEKTLLHCGSANRVGAVWLAYRVLDQGVPFEEALKEAETVGLRSPGLLVRIQDYLKRNQAPVALDRQGAKPELNASFRDPSLNVQQWIDRFETESREVYTARNEIVKAMQIAEGNRIADVGAGTGLFTRIFAHQVGSNGQVFAVEISPAFLQHIATLPSLSEATNVTPVLANDHSILLPADSIDLAFVCDTYHHFEFPQDVLATIDRSLKPGGWLVVVDFERIPGVSSAWILDHVRAGKETVRAEIEAAGLEWVDEPRIAGLKENYLMRFRKPGKVK